MKAKVLRFPGLVVQRLGVDFATQLKKLRGTMPKVFQTEIENDDGWSDWIHPLQKPYYKMACCDCGLVHNMQFRIDEQGRINFRASRNRRSTAQLRRHRHRTEAST